MKLPTKRRYPKTLIIKGEEWRIAWVDRIEGADVLGLCDPSNRIIYIKNKQSAKQTFLTYLHEVLHALEMEYDISISHRAVYKLEVAIHSFLMDNF